MCLRDNIFTVLLEYIFDIRRNGLLMLDKKAAKRLLSRHIFTILVKGQGYEIKFHSRK